MSSESASRVLVRLTGVSQELTVGVGAAIASVRTLTDVSLVVRAREMIVLSGGSGGGERAVLAVIAGDRRGVSGTCEVHDNARIRALRISASAALALAQEWQRAELDASTGGEAPDFGDGAGNAAQAAPSAPRADLLLLDVVPDSGAVEHSAGTRTTAGKGRWRSARLNRLQHSRPLPFNEKNRQALYDWAVVCQRRGGAIAMAVNEEFGLDLLNSDRAPRSSTSIRRQVLAHAERQPVGSRDAVTSSFAGTAASPTVSAVRETPARVSRLRVVAMHCGRLAASIPISFRSRPLAS